MFRQWLTHFFHDPSPRIDPYEVDNEFTLTLDFPNDQTITH